ncbi:hypothetical protein SAMN05216353_1109 [Halobacillus alkaliphilus]|uniref:Uncharacterized protein n=1 Tax=Halobacillus alkaliphilus TaxID=396056 RepID=A0A1I2LSP8_9BACI|nr:hypothetical protein SAMN05216353_1109 [Halobacillus alkaliphilus]
MRGSFKFPCYILKDKLPLLEDSISRYLVKELGPAGNESLRGFVCTVMTC